MTKFIILQQLWAKLPLATQAEILKPYFVDSPEWTVLSSLANPIKEE